MNTDIYELYLQCFPEYPCSQKWFNELLLPGQATVLTERQSDGNLIAFVMIWGNSISLLCVDSAYRNQGVGSRLLQQDETQIMQSGATKVILGRGSHYLLQGVPTTLPQTVAFFERRGYSANWISANMALSLEKFYYEKLTIPSTTTNVTFRFAAAADREALLSAVNDAQPNWCSVFENCVDPIFLAVETETSSIIGFEILSPNGGRFTKGDQKVGSVGCVGVIPSAREKGVGRRMVAKGIEWLKSQCCSAIELRYVELVEWYKALGFEVIGWQWMGEKMLRTTYPPMLNKK